MLRLAFAIQTLLLVWTPSAGAHFNTSFTPEGQLCVADTLGLGSAGKNTNPGGYAKAFYGVKTVVIDPGHGGHDPGCLGSLIHEKEIALGIAQKLAAYIKAQYPEIHVILTRNSDEFIPLHERAQIANRNAADLFISIHCNATSKSSHVHGSETYVLGPHKLEENLQVALRENSVVLHEENYETVYGYDPNSPEAHIILSMYQNAHLESSILFADGVERHMVQSAQRHSRGVKQAGFLVLRETTMPSVLVETGFLSNRQEESYLRSQEGQYAIAQALLAAFTDYKAEVEGSPKPLLVSGREPEAKQAVAVQAVQNTPASPSSSSTPAPPPARTVPEAYSTNGKSDKNTPPPSTQPAEMPRAPYKGIVFRVQLAASSQYIDTRSGKWVHLTYPVEIVEESGMIKYQITANSGFWQAEEIRKQMNQLGFTDAFVVVYQYGQRIHLDEAKRQLGIQ